MDARSAPRDPRRRGRELLRRAVADADRTSARARPPPAHGQGGDPARCGGREREGWCREVVRRRAPRDRARPSRPASRDPGRGHHRAFDSEDPRAHWSSPRPGRRDRTGRDPDRHRGDLLAVHGRGRADPRHLAGSARHAPHHPVLRERPLGESRLPAHRHATGDERRSPHGVSDDPDRRDGVRAYPAGPRGAHREEGDEHGPRPPRSPARGRREHGLDDLPALPRADRTLRREPGRPQSRRSTGSRSSGAFPSCLRSRSSRTAVA